ncbi:hypothetical protein QJS10_CPB22g00088 [Acorus calamus]|uniref:Uncharacterized protein n=1 Tax=Acorus calamus TaxID=4465 RepID=A0AAV9C1L6_ACOCL|nr:hypothetical protein QJS10_CPB22g00088 [Acorus calamus]
MGIIGTLKIVSVLGDINAITSFPSTQKTNSEEAIELLKMSLDSCKLTPLPFILFYDELTILLDCTTLQPSIMEWMGMHIGEFELVFLSDLEGGQLAHKGSPGGLQGELWMNLDGDLSPICLNILSLAFSSSQQQSSSCLQILPAQFQLLSVVERLTNRGYLGGIDALLGCPLHLPSDKHFNEATWKALTGKQREIICLSIYYAINWIRELLNAFSTQVGGMVDCVTQATKEETSAKLLKRLRNLVFLERLLNSLLKIYPLTLPVLHSFVEPPEPAVLSKPNHMKYAGKKSEETKASGNASLNSRRKGKKSSMTPDNSDPNGKLRQPTILDALKRAGVHVSQEVANEGSSGPPSSGKKLQSEEHKLPDSNMLEPAELSGAAEILDAQRFKFRPLLPHCFNILSFAENQDSCCSDPAAELSLHLYLLRDLHFKLNYLSPPSKQLPAACPAKALPCPHKLTVTELLNKIRPQFPCLKKHLDVAICVIKEGSDACQEHWNSRSASSGNPDIPSLMISKSSVASSVIEEVLCCSSKILNLQELGNRTNMSILRDLLENFQLINKPDNLFADIQPFHHWEIWIICIVGLMCFLRMS